MDNKLEIAVGIIRSEEMKIYITQRKEDSHLAGYWEFPGGKMKPLETIEQTLFRELAEEVDIYAEHAIFLTSVTHSYPDREMVLNFFLIEQWDGVPFPKEGQTGRWIYQQELNADNFPEGNRTIIEMLKNQEN